MKTCSNCSATLDTDSVFCTSCGTPIVQTIHCPKCGGTINADVKFCKFCAFDLSQPIQTAATATLPLLPIATLNPETSNLPPQVKSVTPFQANATSVQAEITEDNPASFISPAGAALAVICFFLPWLEFSACGIRKAVSGAEIANQDGSLWLLPLMGIVSIVAYFIFKNQKVLFKARPFIIGSSAFALCFLFYKFNSIPSGVEVFGRRITAADLGIQWQFGSVGTIIGFVLAIIGCAFMSRAIAVVSQGNSSSTSIQEFVGKLQPNIAATLCYAFYILNPIGIIVPFIFLCINPYKQNFFVRFHASQALLLGIVGFAISYLFVLINSQFIMMAGMLVSWGLVAVSIFLAYKSFKNEIFKLPVIGDLATTSKDSQPPHQTSSTSIFTAENYTPSTTVENPDFVPPSPPQSVEETSKDSSQSETAPPSFLSFESNETDTTDRRLLYGVGGGLVGLILLIGIIAWATSSSGNQTTSSSNANANRSSANKVSISSNANRSSSNMTTTYTSNSSSDMSSSERTGRLTTNLNLRSAPNKTALSVGIHFQNTRVKILDEESYDTEDGYSTWYKIAVIEYGCDSQGNLGCGKNSDNDADEGWLNSKYVELD